MRLDFIQLLQAAAWPVAAVIGLLLLRKPIAAFLEGLAPRLTKISAFKVEFELKAASDLSHPSVTALAEIANVPNVTNVGDSSGRLLAAFGESTPSDFMEIDLGQGEEWLTTRVFILAAQMERLRGLRCIVFLQTSEVSRRLVGMASPAAVRWAFAMRWPFLERAYAGAYHSVMADDSRQGYPPWSARVTSAGGAVPPEAAQEIFRKYLREGFPPSVALRVTAPERPPNTIENEWLNLGPSDASPRKPPNHEWERAEWVSGQTLRQVLGNNLYSACVVDSLEATPEKIARAVIRQTAPFVARLRQDLSFDTIVDRLRLATRMGEASGQN
jgi:hypothetical protein